MSDRRTPETKEKRVARAKRFRRHAKETLRVNRLCVHRSPNNIYVQVIAPDDGKVLVQASTLDKELKGKVKHGGNVDAAKLVGALVAKRAKAAKVGKVAFDRAGFKYHGRVKALADAAREAGMEF